MSFEAYGFEPQLIDGVYVGKSGLNYTNVFFYEKKFFNDDYVETKRTWMKNNWHLSIYYACAYMALIALGKWYMSTRDKFDLRRALIAWNFILAAFSLVGTIRVWPDFINTLYTKGITHTMCSSDYAHGVTGCWAWLFILSKVPELVDTIFIVLRKQQLIFLHWYHHATVLVYCWYSCSDFSASGRWFVLMNYTVHSVMYGYYGFRAMRFRIPKWVNIAITGGQILQMVFGIYINCVAYYRKKNGQPCEVSDENIKWSFIMYFTYFMLFFQFFYKTYISKPKYAKIPATGSGTQHSNGNGHHRHANGKDTKHD